MVNCSMICDFVAIIEKGVIMKKYGLILFAVTLLFHISAYSEMKAYSFDSMDKKTYPIVNGLNVRIRSLPHVKYSKILDLVQKGESVKIIAKSKDAIKIDEDSYPWYQVELTDRKLSGWIYGKYVMFQKDYSVERWDIYAILTSRILSRAYFDELQKALGIDHTDGNLRNALKGVKKIISRESISFQGASLKHVRLQTEYGETTVFETEDGKYGWVGSTISYDVPYAKTMFGIKIGMKYDELIAVLGVPDEDIVKNNGRITFHKMHYNPGYDETQYLTISIREGLVDEINFGNLPL
jgi:hypothetical protein